MPKPLKTFICYAREDRDAVDDLRKHLKQAEKKQMLEIWDDGEILAGQDWDKAIKVRLETAQLILMLVSVDFINSDYIEKTELQAALQRHRNGEATLIPVIVRRCDWHEHFGIGQFQALPKEARPIKSVDLSVREEVYYEVAQGIKSVAQEMQIKINLVAERSAAEMAAKQAAEEASARKTAEAKRRQIKDEATWKSTVELDTLEAYEAYLEEDYSLHQEEANQRIHDLTAAEVKRKAEQKAKEKAAQKAIEQKRALFAAKESARKKREKEAADKKKREAEEAARRADPFHDLMIPIKGGTFDMGDILNMGDTVGDGGYAQKPVHKVTVRDFHIGKYPVTQAQWITIMGDNPSSFKGDDLPVERVSWDDAQDFIKKLNEKTGKKYRLPTEAEWEYAAREGGKKVRFGNGKVIADPKEMNFNATKDYERSYTVVGEYRGKTSPVSQFKPNALGLHDLSGNVWEWCQDVWHDSYIEAPDDGSAWEQGGDSSCRVVRGGSWYFYSNESHTAYRTRIDIDDHSDDCGFRLAR